MKTIGIVIATYNGEKYLENQIDSILNQSLKPNKMIVIDDCSTDATTSLIGEYKRMYPKMIVLEQNKKNLGHKKAFEHGISLCKTDYIALCDQDDTWKPDKLKKCYDTLEQNLDAKLCFHDLELIDESGNSFGKSYWDSAVTALPLSGADARKQLLTFTNFIPGCTMFFSSDLKEYILPIPDSKWILLDWWIAIVAFFLTKPIIVPDTLTCYRLHAEQVCSLMLNIQRKRKKHSLKEVPYKIVREIRRIVFRKKEAEIRLQENKERECALSQDVLRVISMYEALNLNYISKEELSNLKEMLKQKLMI